MSAEANLDTEYPPLKGLMLLIVSLAIPLVTFMEILDMTIVNVSIPSIAGSLAVSPSEGTWVVSSYMLAAAIMQPLSGWLGRRFGEVRTLVTSVVLFVIFSAVCGFATSMPMLVASRLVQGIVSGPMQSVAQAVLLRNYPPSKRGVALGLWGMVVIAAPVFGPILGGWITDNLSWRWLFFINIPTGLLLAFVLYSILGRRESRKVKVPIDSVGLALLVIGVGSLQFVLDNGNNEDWFASSEIIWSSVAAVLAITFLIVWELTEKHPILDLHLFQRRNYVVGVVGVAVGFFSLTAFNILTPLWLQIVLGYTATMAGYALAPMGILAVIVAPFLGRRLHSINVRALASISFIGFAAVIYEFANLNGDVTFWQIVLPRLCIGPAMPMFFLSLNQIALSAMTPDELASAAGLANFLRTMAGSMSTAATIWIWNHRIDYHHAVLAEHVNDASLAWTQYQGKLDALGISGDRALQMTENLLSYQAATMGTNDVFYVCAALLVPMIFWVWLARPPFIGQSRAEAM